VTEARRLCEDALLGIGLALDEAEFADDRLVRALLGRELTRAVRRVFGGGGRQCGHAHGEAHTQHDSAPSGRGSALAGLASVAGLAAVGSLLSIRHRRCFGERCCCECGEEACCDCSCDCCCEGCCEGCDCAEACCSCDCG